MSCGFKAESDFQVPISFLMSRKEGLSLCKFHKDMFKQARASYWVGRNSWFQKKNGLIWHVRGQVNLKLLYFVITRMFFQLRNKIVVILTFWDFLTVSALERVNFIWSWGRQFNKKSTSALMKRKLSCSNFWYFIWRAWEISICCQLRGNSAINKC